MHLLLTVISSRVLAEPTAWKTPNLVLNKVHQTFQYPDLVLCGWQVVTPHLAQVLKTLLTVISNRFFVEIFYIAREENLNPKCFENLNLKPGVEQGAPGRGHARREGAQVHQARRPLVPAPSTL